MDPRLTDFPSEVLNLILSLVYKDQRETQEHVQKIYEYRCEQLLSESLTDHKERLENLRTIEVQVLNAIQIVAVREKISMN
jgi:hypothetical protein